ncbi:MAG TPA: 2-amino-4-hydroxy-6-hydroxymethyldihydropteridine diphosphokinase [Thermoanaerobaculia bacterium]|nr:2-amino-4-hydroxy-6-hydroxymethyldihydropteridine diphosphokinase [Thermoanaerobaculia bacterium]
MARALVSFGSNIAPEAHLPAAKSLLRMRCAVLRSSAAYRTAAVGPAGQPDFLNAAVVLATPLAPTALKETILRPIEAELGRLRSGDPYAPRTLDLDLLLFRGGGGDEGAASDPDLTRRVHLAVPAAEVAPRWRHPASGETLAAIARRLLASGAPAPERVDLPGW